MHKTIPFLTHADESVPMMDINTTPLIDVMLVLLIVLLLSLPAMTHAVKMDLPTKGTTLKREMVNVEIDFDGALYWNGAAVADLTQLERYFKATAAQVDQPEIQVDANRRTRYDVVAKVLSSAQRSGVRYLGLVGNERFAE
jgi:biopolymer transport protein ExbD